MRKKQKSAERRRGFAIVGVCVVVAAASSSAPPPTSRSRTGGTPRQFDDTRARATIGAAGRRSARTSPPRRPTATRTTSPTGTPVDYDDAPPAFGPHWNEAGVAPAPFDAQVLHRRRPPRARGAGAQPRARLHDPLVRRDDRRRRRRDQRASRRIARQVRPATTTSATSSSPPRGPPTRTATPFPDGQHIAFTHWSAGGAGETDATQAGRRLAVLLRRQRRGARDVHGRRTPTLDSPEPDAM